MNVLKHPASIARVSQLIFVINTETQKNRVSSKLNIKSNTDAIFTKQYKEEFITHKKRPLNFFGRTMPDVKNNCVHLQPLYRAVAQKGAELKWDTEWNTIVVIFDSTFLPESRAQAGVRNEDPAKRSLGKLPPKKKILLGKGVSIILQSSSGWLYWC